MASIYRAVNRVFAIFKLLEGARQGLTIKDVYERLKEEYPANERTYRRDFENLANSGLIVALDDSSTDASGVKYKAESNLLVGKPLILKIDELFAQYVGRHMLAPLKGTLFFKDIDSVFQKIETILGTKCREHLTTLSNEIHFEPGPQWGLGIDSDVLQVVEQCCGEGHVLTANYDSVNSGEKRERTLGPHFLYFAKGSIYLVAEDLEDKITKVFALPRMSKPEMLEQTYDGAKVDPEKFFKSAFGVFRGDQIEHIELLFRPPYAASVRERRWHSSQKIIPCEKGMVRLTLDVAITSELIQWVLGFADGVRVEKPEALVKEVVLAARAITAQYGKKKT